MTKTEFFKDFVAKERIKRPTYATLQGGRQSIYHLVLRNGWTLPQHIATQLKARRIPNNAEFEILTPKSQFDPALRVKYRTEKGHGEITLLYGVFMSKEDINEMAKIGL